MRIHYIIHAPFENLGVIEDWIANNKHIAVGTHTYRGEQLPDVSEFDFLIVMGGPQCAVNIDRHPYLQQEVALIQQAIQTNKAVLGICLGSQLLGLALGAAVEHSPHKEIGAYPIETTQAAEDDLLFKQFPKRFSVMQWHSDMPGLSDDCVLLASSAGCPTQAFRYGDRVYGFQFHLEFLPKNVIDLLTHCGDDLTPGQYVSEAEELLALELGAINHKMVMTLDYLAERVTSS